jgi:hypothetical protein
LLPSNPVISQKNRLNGNINLLELSIINITLSGSTFSMINVINNPINQTIIDNSPYAVYPFNTLVVVKPADKEPLYYGVSFSSVLNMGKEYYFDPGKHFQEKKFNIGQGDGEYYFEVIYRMFTFIPCNQTNPVKVVVKSNTITNIVENYPRNDYSKNEFTITNVSFVKKENIDENQQLTLDVTYNTNYGVYPRMRCERIDYYPILRIFGKNKTEIYSGYGRTGRGYEISLERYVIKQTQTKSFTFNSKTGEYNYTQFPEGKYQVTLTDWDNYITEENSVGMNFTINRKNEIEIEPSISVIQNTKSNSTDSINEETITGQSNQERIIEYQQLVREIFSYFIAGGIGSTGGIVLAIVVKRK